MKNSYKISVIVLLTVFVFQASPASAQWRIGVSGGADYNWYSIKTNYQTDYRYDGAWGWNAAIFTQYDFLPWVGLRAEVEASEINYRFYRTGYFTSTNYITHNTYLKLPVMTQFRFGGEKVHGFLNAGVYAGCWLAGRQKGTITDPRNGRVITINEPYVFNKEKDQRADFGLAGGVGIEYLPAEHWAIHIEGRCYYSFISQTKPYMIVRDNRYNTTLTIQAGVSYIF